jgi:hypothetical protein
MLLALIGTRLVGASTALIAEAGIAVNHSQAIAVAWAKSGILMNHSYQTVASQ